MKVLVLLFFTTVLASITTNPYSGARLYVDPRFVTNVESVVSSNPNQATLLRYTEQYSTAFWVASISQISALDTFANTASRSSPHGTVISVVIYDIPNRDCSAGASHGEINCADATCTEGLNRYKSAYIDPIFAVFQKYSNLTFSAILEPDALPNIATNTGTSAKCAQSVEVYKTGIAYAISKFSLLSNIAIYLDVGNGQWLGWPNNLNAITNLISQTLQLAGGSNLIRGFCTNISNFRNVGSVTSTDDRCNLAANGNAAIDEAHYVQMLTSKLDVAGIRNKGFIIDTSRNGVRDPRTDCSEWCNVVGAGLGARPGSDTSITGLNNVDMFLWVKTPGESDGACGAAGAPNAGQWFPSYFLALAQNANPALRNESIVISSTSRATSRSTSAQGSTSTQGSTASRGSTGVSSTGKEGDCNDIDFCVDRCGKGNVLSCSCVEGSLIAVCADVSGRVLMAPFAFLLFVILLSI